MAERWGRSTSVRARDDGASVRVIDINGLLLRTWGAGWVGLRRFACCTQKNISDGDLEIRICSPNRKWRLSRCGPLHETPRNHHGCTVESNRLSRSVNGRAMRGRECRVRMRVML